MWFSDSARQAAPWSSRHRRVVAPEKVAAHFHHGHAESAVPNPVSDAGIPTCFPLAPEQTLAIDHIIACVPLPARFDEVVDVHPAAGRVVLTSRAGLTLGLPMHPSIPRFA